MLCKSGVWERHVKSTVIQVKRRSAVRMRKRTICQPQPAAYQTMAESSTSQKYFKTWQNHLTASCISNHGRTIYRLAVSTHGRTISQPAVYQTMAEPSTSQ
ncbi:hypothetical protein PoB_006433600 [Plakobranchus ocellatus]|uniref:Uncharacterized protein n=1 Tax=Plakobranchus ocellatus TaxID=259542 RepID=A0AAV4D1H4_9GAST|nr:hypothetical protein PoB_006433600 [Plakobranchus ocellatus]